MEDSYKAFCLHGALEIQCEDNKTVFMCSFEDFACGFPLNIFLYLYIAFSLSPNNLPVS